MLIGIGLNGCITSQQAYIDDAYYSPGFARNQQERQEKKLEKLAAKEAKIKKRMGLIDDKISYNEPGTTNVEPKTEELPAYDEYEYADRMTRFQDEAYNGTYYTADTTEYYGYDGAYNVNYNYYGMGGGYNPYSGFYMGINYAWGTPYYSPWYDPWYGYYPYYSAYYSPYYYPYYGCCYPCYYDAYPGYPIAQAGYGKRRSTSGSAPSGPVTAENRRKTNDGEAGVSGGQVYNPRSISTPVSTGTSNVGGVKATNNSRTRVTSTTNQNNNATQGGNTLSNTRVRSTNAGSAATPGTVKPSNVTNYTRPAANPSRRNGYTPSYSRPKPSAQPRYNQNIINTPGQSTPTQATPTNSGVRQSGSKTPVYTAPSRSNSNNVSTPRSSGNTRSSTPSAPQNQSSPANSISSPSNSNAGSSAPAGNSGSSGSSGSSNPRRR